ncbi:MAG TPA: DUF1501 domain-containing protein [Verrucomicrobiales bacterium]|nr:DUF1501 domain-containing protein [Verrucomicrobiales bacterium]
MKPDHSALSRRRFMGQANCALISAIPVLNTLLNLRLAGTVAAQGQGTGYRALVCLFASGGNDTFNVLSPYSGPSSTAANSFTEYTAARSNLALTHAQQIEITPDNTPGRTFGVHSAMPKLAALFAQQKAAFVANVGTLVEPVFNRTQVAQSTKRLPLGLYSHSDQTEQWQTSVPHSRAGVGWAGRMMDLIKSFNAEQRVSMNISMDGSNVWQTGVTGAEYAVSAGNDQQEGGAVGLSGYRAGYDSSPFNNAASTAVDSQLAATYQNLLQQTFVKKRREAQDAYAIYSAATGGTLPGSIVFPNTQLGRQLKQVAKTIMGRAGMGASRQTFFVNRGGWDHHSDTLANQQGMLPEMDAAIDAFYRQLEVMGLQNDVTLFSASDFGRTLTSNGRGSDHAWGGNAFIVGGSVRGRKIYGQYPSLAVNPESGGEVNPLDTGRGRLIPTTSCDTYFAELALWLGVPRSSLPLVLPNIGNFISTSGSDAPLGFLV